MGVTRQQLRTLLSNGQVSRVGHGRYIVAQPVYDDDAMRVATAVSRAPRGAVLTGTAAARLLQLPRPRLRQNARVQFILPESNEVPLRNFRTELFSVSARDIPREHVIERGGIRVTSPTWTAIEMALGEPLPFALIALDGALRQGVRRAELESAQVHFRLRRGISSVSLAITEASAFAESALESRSRGVFIEAGLPRPELQRRIQLANGRLAYLDIAWPQFALAGEVDGLIKYPDAQGYRNEKIREMQLRRLRLNVERWTLWDLDHGLPALINRLSQYMIG